MKDRCKNCIHIQICKWTDEMVANHSCDWYIDQRPHDIVIPIATIEVDEEKINELVKEAIERARPREEWILCSERLPEERINPNTNDFEYVLCSTTFDDVRLFKYGRPTLHDKYHFWNGFEIFDKYITAWQKLPEPYKKEGAE